MGKKNIIDIVIMIAAYAIGMTFSVESNPLYGIAFLVLAVSVRYLWPKLPVMIKSHSKN